jgi:hypothetical protein
VTGAYNEEDIVKLVRGLDLGNPGQNREALLVLRKILADPAGSGLSDDTLEKVRIAVG